VLRPVDSWELLIWESEAYRNTAPTRGQRWSWWGDTVRRQWIRFWSYPRLWIVQRCLDENANLCILARRPSKICNFEQTHLAGFVV